MTAAVLPAAFVKLSMLTDGTIRLVLDVEPKDRAAAFAAFDRPGVPVALARLTNEAAVAQDRARAEAPADPPPPHKLPPMPSALCAIRCREFSFQEFCVLGMKRDPAWRLVKQSDGGGLVDTVAFVHAFCRVTSRAELNTDSEALKRWDTLCAEYEQWQRSA